MEKQEEKPFYFCEKCKTRYDFTHAHKKEMKCCGVPLKIETERATKSTPTPFGP
jgi:transcription initiation factor IIE alpha subunit